MLNILFITSMTSFVRRVVSTKLNFLDFLNNLVVTKLVVPVGHSQQGLKTHQSHFLYYFGMLLFGASFSPNKIYWLPKHVIQITNSYLQGDGGVILNRSGKHFSPLHSSKWWNLQEISDTHPSYQVFIISYNFGHITLNFVLLPDVAGDPSKLLTKCQYYHFNFLLYLYKYKYIYIYIV